MEFVCHSEITIIIHYQINKLFFKLEILYHLIFFLDLYFHSIYITEFIPFLGF